MTIFFRYIRIEKSTSHILNWLMKEYLFMWFYTREHRWENRRENRNERRWISEYQERAYGTYNEERVCFVTFLATTRLYTSSDVFYLENHSGVTDIKY